MNSCLNQEKKGYVRFANKYNDVIHVGLGAWVDMKSSDFGLTMDIIHNIPLQSYNVDYKVHQDLSLLSVCLKPALINQAVDIVMASFTIKSGNPKDYINIGVVVKSKRELFDAIMKNQKEIYVVNPKKNCKVKEQVDFYFSLCNYKDNFITQYLYRIASSKFAKVMKALV